MVEWPDRDGERRRDHHPVPCDASAEDVVAPGGAAALPGEVPRIAAVALRDRDRSVERVDRAVDLNRRARERAELAHEPRVHVVIGAEVPDALVRDEKMARTRGVGIAADVGVEHIEARRARDLERGREQRRVARAQAAPDFHASGGRVHDVRHDQEAIIRAHSGAARVAPVGRGRVDPVAAVERIASGIVGVGPDVVVARAEDLLPAVQHGATRRVVAHVGSERVGGGAFDAEGSEYRVDHERQGCSTHEARGHANGEHAPLQRRGKRQLAAFGIQRERVTVQSVTPLGLEAPAVLREARDECRGRVEREQELAAVGQYIEMK